MDLLLSTVIAEGTLASRPAAGINGRIYFATDTRQIFRDNGSSWDEVTVGFANPMTTAGDLIVGGAAGAAGRLAIGANGTVLTSNGSTTNWVAPASNLVIGWRLNSGISGTNVGGTIVASRAGIFNKCKVAVDASDSSTDLIFKINRNGTNIFSTNPDCPAGSAAGLLTFTAIIGAPLAVNQDDLFTLDVTSGTSSWKASIQLEQ